MSKPGNDHVRYEVITQEDPVTGDLLLPIPPTLLEEMGWTDGDEIEFGITPEGKYFLQKINK